MSPSSDTAEALVVLPAHLHARPAGALAKAAAGFESDVEIVHQDKSVNPVGILAIMSLGATAGTTITVRAQGSDARQAVTELAELLRGID